MKIIYLKTFLFKIPEIVQFQKKTSYAEFSPVGFQTTYTPQKCNACPSLTVLLSALCLLLLIWSVKEPGAPSLPLYKLSLISRASTTSYFPPPCPVLWYQAHGEVAETLQALLLCNQGWTEICHVHCQPQVIFRALAFQIFQVFHISFQLWNRLYGQEWKKPIIWFLGLIFMLASFNCRHYAAEKLVGLKWGNMIMTHATQVGSLIHSIQDVCC